MTKDILIVGGGYAGLYTAWQLERRLKRGEARVTVLDPRPYMTYQPFLPEVVSGRSNRGTRSCRCAVTCAGRA